MCLCGSTKFKEEFFKVAKEFTLKGYIVTMPMVFVHSGDEEINEVQKEYLDEVLKNGAERAERLAYRTLSKVYKKVGLVLRKR